MICIYNHWNKPSTQSTPPFTTPSIQEKICRNPKKIFDTRNPSVSAVQLSTAWRPFWAPARKNPFVGAIGVINGVGGATWMALVPTEFTLFIKLLKGEKRPFRPPASVPVAISWTEYAKVTGIAAFKKIPRAHSAANAVEIDLWQDIPF